MTVKERLIQYIIYKNMSQGAFEKRVGLSNGYVNNIVRSPSDKIIQRITQVSEFSDLNPVWLRMGVGEMLREDETLLEDPKTPYETGVCLNCLKKDCEIHELHELIKEKDHRITELNEIITQQIKQWGASTSSWRVPDEGRNTG